MTGTVHRCLGRNQAGESDLDLALDVRPFLAGAWAGEDLVERAHRGRCELEPGQEVERLAQVPAVMQSSRHRWKGGCADPDVVRALLEDVPALVLGELPPTAPTCGSG